jgi:hypothetical protein
VAEEVVLPREGEVGESQEVEESQEVGLVVDLGPEMLVGGLQPLEIPLAGEDPTILPNKSHRLALESIFWYEVSN